MYECRYECRGNQGPNQIAIIIPASGVWESLAASYILYHIYLPRNGMLRGRGSETEVVAEQN